MIILTMKMNVRPEKRDELLQTIFALIPPTRKEKGCLSYHAFLSIEDENEINLVEEWESQEDLNNHFLSDRFSALIGAQSLLNKPLGIRIITASSTAGMEDVEAARGRQTRTSPDLAESRCAC